MKKFVVLAISLAMLGGSFSAFASPPINPSVSKDAANAKRQEILACKKVAKESYQSKLVNIEKIRNNFTKSQQEKMGVEVKAAQTVYKAALEKARSDFAAAKKAAQATYKSTLDTAKTTIQSNKDEYKKDYNTTASACESK